MGDRKTGMAFSTQAANHLFAGPALGLSILVSQAARRVKRPQPEADILSLSGMTAKKARRERKWGVLFNDAVSRYDQLNTTSLKDK
jgi:hypothetical protein